MHEKIIAYLNQPISLLKGVGPNYIKRLRLLNIKNFKNLICHLPYNLIDRSYSPSLKHAKDGDLITTIVDVVKHEEVPHSIMRKKNAKLPYKIITYNDTGFLNITYFNGYPQTLKKLLPVGEKRVVSGEIKKFNDLVSMSHPDYITTVDKIDTIRKIEPIYPLTAGLTNGFLSKYINYAVKNIPQFPEWLDEKLINKYQWNSFSDSLKIIHNPQNINDLNLHSKARSRLAYDELLLYQLILQLNRKKHKNNQGKIICGNGNLQKKLLENLPFSLTSSQQEVIKEILVDQKSVERMLRLLQGDVGAGKTVVALMIALNTIEAGFQVALMAPTEILANQHYQWIEKVTQGLGIKIALLTGKIKAKEKREIYQSLQDGDTNLIIGTHALFQEDVVFANLGLSIIDEQHRFGVEQRLNLYSKGEGVDILLMSATPIPRTLTLASYGDMDCSRLTEKPAGRKAILTTTHSLQKLGELILRLDHALNNGEKIYWICPLVEESEKLDLAAVNDRYESLNKIWPNLVGVVHGKMPAAERDKTVKDFRDSKIRILVATTVIEVGIDVPDATIMIIEHADRFGLSQLHQLRGRVGRGDKASFCMLLYNYPLSNNSKERLKIMTQTEDGFEIAEADLRIRGAGDIIGTRQSGLPEFIFANIIEHQELLMLANRNAKYILEKYPDYKHEIWQNIKLLAEFFEYDLSLQEFVG